MAFTLKNTSSSSQGPLGLVTQVTLAASATQVVTNALVSDFQLDPVTKNLLSQNLLSIIAGSVTFTGADAADYLNTLGASPFSSTFPGQTTMANSNPVTIASDQSAVPISGTVTGITNPVTVAQATAANLNATVVGTGTFATQSTLAAKSYSTSASGIAVLGPFDVSGQGTAVIQIRGTYSATVSVVGGNNSAQASNLPMYLFNNTISGWSTAAITSISGGTTGTFLVSIVGFSYIKILVNPYVSGTVTFDIFTAPATQFQYVLNDIPANLQTTTTPIAITKGTQGATGFTTQDLKDAGRTAISLYAINAASGATTIETAITLTKSAGTAATTTGASFVITNGKTFRIQQISVATRGNTLAVAQTTTFNLRLNTGGAVTTTSTPIIFSAVSATPATSLAWDRYILPIPDGLEIAGNGTIQFGITAASTFVTSAPTWDVNIIGYEY